MVIGWRMNKNMKTQLIYDALNMAIWKRKPPSGVVHHSDRESQYCSEVYRALQAQHGFVCSMIVAGNCYNNAVMGSFYHAIKVELTHGQRCQARDEASKAIFDYIEVCYNRRRLHSSLGYQTPEMFDRAA
jgi:putative transposase